LQALGHLAGVPVRREPVHALANFPGALWLSISQSTTPQELGLCQLCRHRFFSIFSVLPDRDDRQFYRHNMLI
jgi:hypothetical protein